MKSELLAKSPLLALPLIALFLFIAVFVAMVFVTMKKRAPAYDPLARMPLDDGDEANDAQEGAPR
ncbi:MAG TPA: hypothetical protein VLT33_50390 [Labilithrix sp.]|nr:hypothetical protein [Labilithrix sp.]